MSTALTKSDLPQIVLRYAAGESVQALATEAGVARSTIYNWMLSGVGDEKYNDIVTSVLIRHIAEADQALADATQPHEISKAREQARFARMDLERRRPHLYGVRTQIDVRGDISTALQELSERLAARTIEGEPPQCVTGDA